MIASDEERVQLEVSRVARIQKGNHFDLIIAASHLTLWRALMRSVGSDVWTNEPRRRLRSAAWRTTAGPDSKCRTGH